MPKVVFKTCNQGQVCMFPMSLKETIPANAPVRLVNQIVDNIDISKVICTCKGGGTSSYYPEMMLKLVIFVCLNNIYMRKSITYNRYLSSLKERIAKFWQLFSALLIPNKLLKNICVINY